MGPYRPKAAVQLGPYRPKADKQRGRPKPRLRGVIGGPRYVEGPPVGLVVRVRSDTESPVAAGIGRPKKGRSFL